MSAPAIRTRTAARLAAAVALVVSAFALPAATSNANAPTGSGHVRALFFGDSLMNGTGSRPTRPVMARVAARRLGWGNTLDALGGGRLPTRGRTRKTFPQKTFSPRGVVSPHRRRGGGGGPDDQS